jgi:hypothetical protein
MGAWLSNLSDCLWRQEASPPVYQPGLLEHYHRLQKDMCDIESLLEQRVKNSRCC